MNYHVILINTETKESNTWYFDSQVEAQLFLYNSDKILSLFSGNPYTLEIIED